VIATSEGVRIAYETRGEGPSLVLVHGLGYGRWGWEPVLDALAERFSVVCMDNRGVGASDAPPGPYTAGAMARDVAAVMEDAGLERAHVLGTSLGGMVAQELALARPELVDRLVLVCTTPGGPEAYPLPERTLVLFANAATLPREEALRLFVENALGEDPEPRLVERILAHRRVEPQTLEAWQAQAAAGAGFDAWERVPSIQAPTLVVHGTADHVVDVRNAELLARLLPDARVELLEGAGHLLFWEQPDEFVRLVTRFLEGA
jgi:3-oxoadipate enol-lactonase